MKPIEILTINNISNEQMEMFRLHLENLNNYPIFFVNSDDCKIEYIKINRIPRKLKKKLKKLI